MGRDTSKCILIETLIVSRVHVSKGVMAPYRNLNVHCVCMILVIFNIYMTFLTFPCLEHNVDNLFLGITGTSLMRHFIGAFICNEI